MDVEPEVYLKFEDIFNDSEQEQGHFAIGYTCLDDIDLKSEDMYGLVVDIGCGTGKSTSLLASRLNGDSQVYAIDIDEKMIAFAKHNNSKPGITYLVQDFAAEFDSFAPELKALEGKVDLIVALYCLHYVCDEERVAINMYRLLAKGGVVRAPIILVKNPFDELNGAEKECLEREWMKVPAVDTQRNKWLNAFKSVGFCLSDDKPIVREHCMARDNYERVFIPQQLTNYRRYYVNASDGEKVNGMDRRLRAKLISNIDKYTDKRTGAAMVKVIFISMNLVLKK